MGQKNKNNVKKALITTHIRLDLTGQILLPFNVLRGGIRFRTPWNVKELKNLPKMG